MLFQRDYKNERLEDVPICICWHDSFVRALFRYQKIELGIASALEHKPSDKIRYNRGDKLTTELGTELGDVKTIDRTNIIVTKQRKTSQVLTPR